MFVHLACRHRHHGLSSSGLICVECKPVHFKKKDTCHEAGPLIAVEKWMIANDANRIQGCQYDNVRSLCIGVVLPRTGQC